MASKCEELEMKTLKCRCYLSPFIDKMNEVRPCLTAAHYQLIDKLPFAHFFYLSQTIRGEEKLLDTLIGSYDPRVNGFKLGRKMVKFTMEEMCLILGLKCYGTFVSFEREESSIRDQYLKGVKLDKYHISAAVEVALRENDVEGVVKLLVLFLFVCFLLPTTGGRISPGLCSYVDNLETIGDYAWGDVVYNWLMKELPSKARAIQARNNGKQVTMGYLRGCTQALQVWVKEHSASEWTKCNLGGSPRLLNWEMQAKDFKKFLELDWKEVSDLPLKPLQFEQWLLNPTKAKPSNWLVCIKMKIETGAAPSTVQKKRSQTMEEESKKEIKRSKPWEEEEEESKKEIKRSKTWEEEEEESKIENKRSKTLEEEESRKIDLTVELLKAELEAMVAQLKWKDHLLRAKDIRIKLLTDENEKLKEVQKEEIRRRERRKEEDTQFPWVLWQSEKERKYRGELTEDREKRADGIYT